MNEFFEGNNYQTADELWDALSPTTQKSNSSSDLLYRGMARADWGLVPAVLRSEPNQNSMLYLGKKPGDNTSTQIRMELFFLEKFMNFCDKLGIVIPNDSKELRGHILSPIKMDEYCANPSLWPNQILIDFMAFAQQNEVPSRLLEWSKSPYVACYFAASEALKNRHDWQKDTELALWVLNAKLIGSCPTVQLVRRPSLAVNYAFSQSGFFTVHPHCGKKGEGFEVSGLELECVTLPESPLQKMTLPATESVRLYDLCKRAGFTAASIFPSAVGAGRVVVDELNYKNARADPSFVRGI